MRPSTSDTDDALRRARAESNELLLQLPAVQLPWQRQEQCEHDAARPSRMVNGAPASQPPSEARQRRRVPSVTSGREAGDADVAAPGGTLPKRPSGRRRRSAALETIVFEEKLAERGRRRQRVGQDYWAAQVHIILFASQQALVGAGVWWADGGQPCV